MTDTELRRAIPGWVGEYDLSNKGTVFTIGRVITRSNGTRYKIRPRRRRWCRDHSGLLYMKLARNGHYTDVYRHKLMAEVWGDLTCDQAAA
jgi:hypothetical protein